MLNIEGNSKELPPFRHVAMCITLGGDE